MSRAVFAQRYHAGATPPPPSPSPTPAPGRRRHRLQLQPRRTGAPHRRPWRQMDRLRLEADGVPVTPIDHPYMPKNPKPRKATA